MNLSYPTTRQFIISLMSVCLLGVTSIGYTKSFTSIKVIKSAHSHSCLDYHILPNPCIYMYLSCSLFGGCGIKFTARDRIRHKLPDLVVSSFRKPGQNPWSEIRATESKIAKHVMDTVLVKAFNNIGFDGAGRENAHVTLGLNLTKKNLRFNETNVIGSPAAKVVRQTMRYTVPFIFGGPFLCKSSSKPFFPYMMSELDAIAWRKSEINILDTAVDIAKNGITHIGSLSLHNLKGNTWGPLHPRVGFVFQTEPAKSAAVTAQRAIDVVSKPYQFPHVYVPYGYNGSRTVSSNSAADCSDGLGIMQRDPYCIKSLPSHPNYDEMSAEEKQQLVNEQCPIQCITANSFIQKMPPANLKTPAWQMIIPKESSSCEAFGSADVNWANDKNVEDGDYAWNYWRQYECCKPGPGILLNP